jgi:hypothetical protein
VPFINVGIRHTLTDQVGADGKAFQAMFRQGVMPGLHIPIAGKRLFDIKVIPPAGQFQAIIAKSGSCARQRIQREIGPLTGKQSDWPRHLGILSR